MMATTRLAQHNIEALNVVSAANTVTKTVIAVITLLAAVLIVGGILRAWRGRLRPQVVIEDIAFVDQAQGLASPGLSPQLRQEVRQALLSWREDASYSVLKTIEQDIDQRLLRIHGRIRIRPLGTGPRSTAEDSLATLAAGVGAVAPKQAAGLVAVLAAVLPAQRGWVVRAFPAVRGTGAGTQVGLVLELAQLSQAPDAVTSFWTRAGDGGPSAIHAPLGLLLHPAATWIATRLISRQLAESEVPARWRFLPGRKRERELLGLQMQLAGQLSLYAARRHEDFDREFAEQALGDLAESARLLPEYYRPHSTEAGVRERRGWSHCRVPEPEQAKVEFGRAVRAGDRAIQKLSALAARNDGGHDAALARIRVRRTKCRLLSGDPADFANALTDLASPVSETGATALDLYNAACLYAVAVSQEELLENRAAYTADAWRLLGLALLADGADGPWRFALEDIELSALSVEQRRDFSAALRREHPELTPLQGGPAGHIVAGAMAAIGVPPPDGRALSDDRPMTA